jgi:hypothetical protein
MELPLRGGCVCGAIRYEIAQEPLRVYACHCKDCQRFTGSAFAIGVVIPSEAFQLTGPETRLVPNGITEGGRLKRLSACPECGTRLFGDLRPDGRYKGMVRAILGGTLDDTSWLRPTIHVWTRSAQPWVVLSDGSTVYERSLQETEKTALHPEIPVHDDKGL